jgi:hypothetical protein
MLRRAGARGGAAEAAPVAAGVALGAGALEASVIGTGTEAAVSPGSAWIPTPAAAGGSSVWRHRFMATEPRPSAMPAAAASVTALPELREARPCADSSRTLATTGMSLGGGSDSNATGLGAGAGTEAGAAAEAGGGTDGGAAATSGAGLGVGMHRTVSFSSWLSRALTGGRKGGGGLLPRASGISFGAGASPPRTTTA